LKNCRRFITNSSCSYYEAPFFLKPKQIIKIGIRNKNRSDSYKNVLKKDILVDVIKKIMEG